MLVLVDDWILLLAVWALGALLILLVSSVLLAACALVISTRGLPPIQKVRARFTNQSASQGLLSQIAMNAGHCRLLSSQCGWWRGRRTCALVRWLSLSRTALMQTMEQLWHVCVLPPNAHRPLYATRCAVKAVQESVPGVQVRD
jgi:hypothetical protein